MFYTKNSSVWSRLARWTMSLVLLRTRPPPSTKSNDWTADERTKLWQKPTRLGLSRKRTHGFHWSKMMMEVPPYGKGYKKSLQNQDGVKWKRKFYNVGKESIHAYRIGLIPVLPPKPAFHHTGCFRPRAGLVQGRTWFSLENFTGLTEG